MLHKIHVERPALVRRSRPRESEMNGAAIDGEGGFFERFGERGMRVAGAGDVFAGCTEGNGGGGFGDEFTRAGSDDVDAEDAIGFFVGEDLHFTFDISQ